MYLLYFILWMVFLGNLTEEVCLFGVVIAAVMFAFTCKFMDYNLKKEINLYQHIPAMLHYGYVLVSEIVKANMTVIHMILSEREELRPIMVHFRSDLESPTARALMADAITLTPGTITVSLEGSDYVVHCLDESLAVGMDESVFADMLRGMEERRQDE